MEAQWAARERGLQRYVTEQPPYSILVRGVEADVLPTCQLYGMGVIPWSPLAGGRLSGPYREAHRADGAYVGRAGAWSTQFDLSLPENQRNLGAADLLAELADKAGVTLVELALAFVLNHSAITAAIIGPRTMEHLQGQLPAADVTLDVAALDRIDEIVPAGPQRLLEPGARIGGASACDGAGCDESRRGVTQTMEIVCDRFCQSWPFSNNLARSSWRVRRGAPAELRQATVSWRTPGCTALPQPQIDQTAGRFV